MNQLSFVYWFLSTIFIIVAPMYYVLVLSKRRHFYLLLICGLGIYAMFNWLNLNWILNESYSYLSRYFYILPLAIPLMIFALTKISTKQVIFYALLSTIFYYLMIQVACLFLTVFYPENFFEYLLVAKIIFTVVQIILLSITRNYFKSRESLHNWRSLTEATCVVTVGVSFNSLIFSVLDEYSILIYLFQLCSMLCCLLFVVFQLEKLGRSSALHDNELAKEMIQSQKEQYSEKENYLELVNFKYHQLKHLITVFDETAFNDISKDIDSMNLLETGNPAIDIALFEINTRCVKEGIRFTSMIDIQSLEKFDVIDLYALLNSLISSLWNIKGESFHDTTSRKLDIRIYQQKKFVRIRIEHNFLEKSQSIDYGQYHLKNALKILERYDGYLTDVYTENSGCIKIFIPLESVEQPFMRNALL